MLKRFRDAIFSTLFAPEIASLRKSFAISETENTFRLGTKAYGELYRDRYDYKRDEILEEALTVWRTNPLARRVVGLTTEYVIGDGFEVSCKHKPTERFIQKLWSHELNKLDEQLPEACDELTRAGDLFPLLTTDKFGMTFIRFVPADSIEGIETKTNDMRQERQYIRKPQDTDLDPKPYKAYLSSKKAKTVMLHYAVNRPVGALWGEPDIGPLIPWFHRYAEWLENRARLNKFRTAFLYILRGKYKSAEERRQRELEVMTKPPKPGSILVMDESEDWGILSASLDAFDANTDGLAIKKMIAAGAGIPLHYLAEPESATRTTAEASGTPTFRHFERRQQFFIDMLKDILHIALERAAAAGVNVDAGAEINITAPDVTERDNAALALATSNIVSSGSYLLETGLIDENEYMRLVYRFAGEVLNPEIVGKYTPPAVPTEKPEDAGGIHVDTETGDVTTD